MRTRNLSILSSALLCAAAHCVQILDHGALLISSGSGGTSVIKHFDRFGNFVENYASGGGMERPHGILLGAEPGLNFHVANFGGGNVLEFNGQTGNLIGTTITNLVGLLEAPGHLIRWRDEFLVCDTKGGGIKRFKQSDATYLGDFAPPGYFGLTMPSDIMQSPFSDNVIFVCSTGTHQVIRYEVDEGFRVATNPTVYSGTAKLIFPRGIAWQATRMLVTDSFNNRIVKIADGGIYDGVFADSHLDNPAGIVVDPLSNAVYVANQGANNVVKFRYDGTYEGVVATGNGLNQPTYFVRVVRSPVVISGRFTFEDWLGEGKPLFTAWLQKGSNPIEMITFNQSTEDNGDYAIGVRVRGTYQMLAKPMRYLKKRTGNLTIGNSGIANVNLNFVCGDAISDNTIDLMDFAQVSMLFGLARDDADYDPRTDLNGDGEINLLDLAIVMKNFGEQGDE